MAFSFFQLTTPVSFEQAEEELLELAEDQGIDTSQWVEGSSELTCLKMIALYYSKMSERVAQVNLNQINKYSSGSALTFLAESQFANSRSLAETTVGNFIITGSSQYVPRTFQAGNVKITDGTVNFYNVEQFTISNAVPFVTASFRAENPGAEYNIPINSVLTFATTEIGFSASNPPNPDSSTWITTFGADEETDLTLQLRNALKYSTLQTGDLTVDRVAYLALSASSNNVYVSVDDSNPRGPNTANVYLSNTTEVATSASIAAAQLAMNRAFFGNSAGDKITCYAASGSYVSEAITIYYSPTVTNLDALKTSVFQIADDWVGSIPIGGNDYSPGPQNAAWVSDLIAPIDELLGVVKVKVNNEYIVLDTNEKLISPDDWNSVFTFTRLNNILTR